MTKSPFLLLSVAALLTSCASAVPVLTATAASKDLYEQAVKRNAPPLMATPNTNANSPAHPFCMSEAHANGVTEARAETLCGTTANLGPATCLHQATANGFKTSQSTNLCLGASSEAPAASIPMKRLLFVWEPSIRRPLNALAKPPFNLSITSKHSNSAVALSLSSQPSAQETQK
jgi:hypothetical protein